MKRIKFIFSLWLVLMMGVFIIQSCETEPILDPCERDQVGTVTVKNSTGYSIWTDVTWGNVVENYEKRVSNGSSTKYSNVPAGSIEIWVSFDGSDWAFNYEHLSACEDMTYTWYLTSTKSTERIPYTFVNGEQVYAVQKEKK